jgi:hypothetical protein
MYELPFLHPKWHVKPDTGEVYEVTSQILEEYDLVIGYIDSVGEVRESIECDEVDERRVEQLSEGQNGDTRGGGQETNVREKRRLGDVEKSGEGSARKRSRRG